MLTALSFRRSNVVPARPASTPHAERHTSGRGRKRARPGRPRARPPERPTSAPGADRPAAKPRRAAGTGAGGAEALGAAQARFDALAAGLRAFAETGIERAAAAPTVGEVIAAVTGELCLVRLMRPDGADFEPVAAHLPIRAAPATWAGHRGRGRDRLAVGGGRRRAAGDARRADPVTTGRRDGRRP